MKLKDPLVWTGKDIDSCIMRGNDGFIQHCFERNWKPKMLLVNELPQVMNMNGVVFECRQSDIDIAIGTLAQVMPSGSMCISLTIHDAVLKCFDMSDSCLLVCGGQTIAVAKRENRYFIFDPHSRDANGMQHHDGSAVLVSFIDIQSLIGFIEKLLMNSLKLQPTEQFELVPIFISEQRFSKIKQVIDTSVAEIGMVDDSVQENPAKQCSQSDASTHTNAQNVDADGNTVIGSMHIRAIDSYFADQKKRDRDFRGKRSLNQIDDTCRNSKRNNYMRNYMQKRRSNDSFRINDNLKAAKRMKRIVSTDEGRKKHNEKEEKKHLRKECVRYSVLKEGREKHNKRSAEGMRKILSTDKGREKHNKRSAEGMQKFLSTDKGREKHNKSSVETMQKILSTEKGREKHNKSSVETMQKILSTEKGREKHNKSSVETMQKILSTEKGREKHNKSSVETMQKILSTEKGREKHNKCSVKTMRKILSTEEGKQKHKEISVKRKQKTIRTKVGRERHNKMSAKGMRKFRSTEEGKQKNKERSAKGMHKIYSSEEGRQRHNKGSAGVMKRNRETIEGRKENKERARKGMGNLRKNTEYARKEYLRRKEQRYGKSFSETVDKFKEAIRSSSSFVCSCCHQTWFSHSVKEVSSLNEISLDKQLLNKCLTGYISVANCEWICNTCLFNVKQGKIPKLSVINGMKFPDRPAELNLSNLEERLISLRIPFMQIRALNSGGQFSLKGSIVNVPSDIEPTIHALPRLRNKSETIPVKLKRMKKFKHAVRTENVRPLAVMTALRTLLDTSLLYQDADISVDDRWNLE